MIALVYMKSVSSASTVARPTLSPAELADLVSTLQVELVGLKSRVTEAEARSEDRRAPTRTPKGQRK